MLLNAIAPSTASKALSFMHTMLPFPLSLPVLESTNNACVLSISIPTTGVIRLIYCAYCSNIMDYLPSQFIFVKQWSGRSNASSSSVHGLPTHACPCTSIVYQSCKRRYCYSVVVSMLKAPYLNTSTKSKHTIAGKSPSYRAKYTVGEGISE